MQLTIIYFKRPIALTAVLIQLDMTPPHSPMKPFFLPFHAHDATKAEMAC